MFSFLFSIFLPFPELFPLDAGLHLQGSKDDSLSPGKEKQTIR